MAADAIYKIKEAEDKGVELIKNATEEAKAIARQAETDAMAQQQSIISEAKRNKTERITLAVQKATANCASLVQQGQKEEQALLNPDPAKLEKAAEIAIERIVNINGHS